MFVFLLNAFAYGCLSVFEQEFKQQPAGGSTHKRKRGRPRKLVVVGPQASEGGKRPSK